MEEGGGLLDVCGDNCSLGSHSQTEERTDSNRKPLHPLCSPFQATPA